MTVDTPFDETYDVVVLGSGASGATTAAVAASRGLRVLLAEKASDVGGGTSYSYGAIWLASDPRDAAPPDAAARAAAMDYLRFLSAGTCADERLGRFIDRSKWAMEQLAELGVRFKTLNHVPDHYFPSAPGSQSSGHVFTTELFPARLLEETGHTLLRSPYVPTGLDWDEAISWGGMTDSSRWDMDLVESRRRDDYCGFGMGLAASLTHACVRHRVEIRTRTAGVRLIRSGRSVVGVELEGGAAGRTRVGTRQGVVLATGGAEGNHALVERFEDLPAWHTHFPPTVTGDGLVMATELGAQITRARHNLRVMLGYRLAVPEQGRSFRSSGVREAAAPHTVIINARGHRFGDESSFQQMVNAVKQFDVATHTYTNYPCYLILDAQFFDKYSFAGRPVAAGPPDWLTRADAVTELAVALGIDPAGLEQTLREFNADVATGKDSRFDRGATPFSNVMGGSARSGELANLGTVERGPFYGIALVPTGISSISLEVDDVGQVMDVRGRAIGGLYACGNAATDIDTGPGYQAGLSHAQGMTMGAVIARTIAERASDANPAGGA